MIPPKLDLVGSNTPSKVIPETNGFCRGTFFGSEHQQKSMVDFVVASTFLPLRWPLRWRHGRAAGVPGAAAPGGKQRRTTRGKGEMAGRYQLQVVLL